MKGDRRDLEFVILGLALVVFVVLRCALAVSQ
jgi:hypothetical protein